MLWIPQGRRHQTRSGTEFSPFGTIATLKASTLDFAPLLAAACLASSGDDTEDVEPSDEHNLPEPDDLDNMHPPPSLDPLNNVDISGPRRSPPPRTPSPVPKRRRTAFDDMKEGKSPLKGNHRRCAAKRVHQKQDSGQKPSASTVRNFVQPTHLLHTSLDTENLLVAHSAYAAKVGDTWGSKKPRYLNEFLRLGFEVVQWNGYDPRPLVDAKGRIFAVLVGQPKRNDYADAVAHVYELLCKEGAAAAFPSNMCQHRRGLFAVINVGLSYGKGQKAPSFLRNGKYAAAADRLLANKHVQRLATFASGSGPRGYMSTTRITSTASTNTRPFSAASSQNLSFHPPAPSTQKKGGHLVLWDLKLVIEFPPGALILLPSATLSHSNVPVQPGDKHISFTQFTAGGLMCFVDNGFRTEQTLADEDPEEYARMLEQKDSRWEMGLGLFSAIDELGLVDTVDDI
ncbi:hypothetical protein C8R43DRAFT_941738 [Mycena crocata]|nr:hypothetical protein C8R43DRAFT_941738 [Mycena crocata]